MALDERLTSLMMAKPKRPWDPSGVGGMVWTVPPNTPGGPSAHSYRPAGLAPGWCLSLRWQCPPGLTEPPSVRQSPLGTGARSWLGGSSNQTPTSHHQRRRQYGWPLVKQRRPA